MSIRTARTSGSPASKATHSFLRSSDELAVVITKDYERVLIGDEDSIKLRLEGEQSTAVVCDFIRPFGTSLLHVDDDQQEKWHRGITTRTADIRFSFFDGYIIK